jgi:ribosomal protein S17E
LTLDFETNKRICDEIAIIASKRLRNKVGFHNYNIRRVTTKTDSKFHRLLVTPPT